MQIESLRFRTQLASELSKVPKNRLQQWVFKGIIQPVKESPGHGMAGEFSIYNIVEVMLVDAFYMIGFPLKKGGKMAREISSKKKGNVRLADGKINITVDVKCYLDGILKRYKAMTQEGTIVKGVRIMTLEEMSRNEMTLEKMARNEITLEEMARDEFGEK
jgi:hypothetical protein